MGDRRVAGRAEVVQADVVVVVVTSAVVVVVTATVVVVVVTGGGHVSKSVAVEAFVKSVSVSNPASMDST